MQASLNALPKNLRTVFILARLEGKTYGEIGEQLGIPTQTAFSRMVRALTLVKEAMDKSEKN